MYKKIKEENLEVKIKMLQFILGLFLGANVSLFLYACILAGAKSDKGDNNLCQKKDTTG